MTDHVVSWNFNNTFTGIFPLEGISRISKAAGGSTTEGANLYVVPINDPSIFQLLVRNSRELNYSLDEKM